MVQQALVQHMQSVESQEPLSDSALNRFASAQAVNAACHVVALRPFHHDEFGAGPASPSAAHVRAANQLMVKLRKRLSALADQVGQASALSIEIPSTRHLQELLILKEGAGRQAKHLEQVWDFYLELFAQRQTRFANGLLAIDRIALDCYQAVYTGLGKMRSIPTPPPFSYMETGFTPATFRRGIPLSRLGQWLNPFPVIQLPLHRLASPWTLGAVHHAASHNLQHDLELWEEVPRRIQRRLQQAGMEPEVWQTWAQWHKEIWADLCGLLLGGPAMVSSLMDVVARSPRTALFYKPDAVHPTPYLRIFISLELLRRMGFPRESAVIRRLWTRMYPSPDERNIPASLLDSFSLANRLVVDTIGFQPYVQLGNKTLAQVVRFKPGFRHMIREAAQRLASGTDPGIIPARFLVGAARSALDQQLTSPARVARNFYQALRKR